MAEYEVIQPMVKLGGVRPALVPRAAVESLVDKAETSRDTQAMRAFQLAGWVPEHGPPVGGIAPLAGPSPRIRGDLVRRTRDQILGILENRFVIKLEDSLDENAVRKVLEEENVKVHRRLEFATHLYEAELARIPTDRRPSDAVREICDKLNGREADGVQFAEPALIEHCSGRESEELGQAHWRQIRVEDVWFGEGKYRGAGQTIAIIDEGFQADHLDLVDNVDQGRSVYFDRNEVLAPGVPARDANDHGTRCAGLAAASLNDRGVCGAAPEAKLMLVTMPPFGVAGQVALARAVAYCADPRIFGHEIAGADVISCSLGPSDTWWWRSRVLECAINFAVRRGRGGLGCPIFWPTANVEHVIPLEAVVGYPNLIAVGATKMNGERAPCGYGKALAFLAPGYGLYTTAPRHEFNADRSGTSLAAPCAAGSAALILQAAAGSGKAMVWKQVKDILKATAASLPRSKIQAPDKRLDALAALKSFLTLPLPAAA